MPKVERECGNCGDVIRRWPSEFEPYDNVFCDKSCYDEWQSDPEPEYDDPHECPECPEAFGTEQGVKVHYAQKHDGSIAGIELVCECCGDTFRRPPSQSRLRFCSPDCAYEFGRGGLGIERVRRILGRECWDAISERARSETDGRCGMCGEPTDELQVHHLLPLRCGGTHATWNLRALCASCHGKAESFAYNLWPNYLHGETEDAPRLAPD